MTIRFNWDESYSVGFIEIDQQHKKMFEIGNSLSEDLNDKQLKRIIMDLYKYLREHFKAEEQLMKDFNYPKLNYHASLHEELISGLNDKTEKIYNNEEALFSFKKFVYDWLIDHILNKDMDYVKFSKELKS